MGEKGGSILATTNNEIIEVLKTIAPGTPIREGLENILKAKTGGLIVIGDGKVSRSTLLISSKKM